MRRSRTMQEERKGCKAPIPIQKWGTSSGPGSQPHSSHLSTVRERSRGTGLLQSRMADYPSVKGLRRSQKRGHPETPKIFLKKQARPWGVSENPERDNEGEGVKTDSIRVAKRSSKRPNSRKRIEVNRLTVSKGKT